MQPYFLPYIGYWQLLNHVDTFVIYDNIQWTKQGWFHRNNLLLNQQKTLFSIPLKKASDTLNVVDRLLADNATAQLEKIIRQIENSYKKAEFFAQAMPTLRRCFLYPEKNLFAYIQHSIRTVVEKLHINTPILISSTLPINHTLKGQDKVIAICRALHASQYINPIGGVALYNSNDFAQHGIELRFLESGLPSYPQLSNEFVPYLSIADALLCAGFEQVQQSLKHYRIVDQGHHV